MDKYISHELMKHIVEGTICPGIGYDEPSPNPTVDPTTTTIPAPAISPTTSPLSPPTTQDIVSPGPTIFDPWPLPWGICESLYESGRNISVIIANDIDGGWRTLAGDSRSGQCNNEMYTIYETLTAIKEPESGASSYPSSIVTYVEFDRDGYEIIVGPDDDVNQMPITTTEFNSYQNLISNRCDTIYQERTCSDIDGERTQLKELLIDIRDNEAKYGFNTTSPEYIGQDRDRFIILFNSCKLPSSEVSDICAEMEDYIRMGGDFGVNVLIINQGSDGFLGETDNDDYILCLAEYDQDRIYTNEQRNKDWFLVGGVEKTICPGIADEEPSPHPTVDPTHDPTASPTQGWVSPSYPLMPRAASSQAIGKWQDEIFLFFGRKRKNQKQVTSYNIRSGDFTDYGLNTLLPPPVYSNVDSAQHYTQTCNYLFTYPRYMNYIYMFDLSNPSSWSNPSKISAVRNMHDGGCITSNYEYLFTLGGETGDEYEPYNTMQMYDLLNKEWINNGSGILPILLTNRAYHSCVIDSNDMLYAIGGLSSNGYEASIERVSIESITTDSWEFIQSLSTPNAGSKAISYLDSIFIIGGYGGSGVYLDIVHIIDINTGIVTVSSDKLVYGVVSPAAIISQQTMYVFGGFLDIPGYDTDRWQYYVLPEQDNEDEDLLCHMNGELF